MRLAFLCVLCALYGNAFGQLIELPKVAPVLTTEGKELIFEGETGGERYYNRRPFPEFPGGPSGVTWGIGYDAHQNARVVIFKDWLALGEKPAQRLAATQPYVGPSARAHLGDVRDIRVPWELASDVFLRVDLNRVDIQCRRAFPNFEALHPLAKDATRSLVFNRGAAMNGPGREEMRALRDCLLRRDYNGAADQEIAMIHLWRGRDIYEGMVNRRRAEARLFRLAARQ